jgi:hypothetical protein
MAMDTIVHRLVSDADNVVLNVLSGTRLGAIFVDRFQLLKGHFPGSD